MVLKNSMNTQRTFSEMSLSPQINITSYWLLGFVEGEGYFNVVREDLGLRFSITQSSINLPILEAIREYLLKLTGIQDFNTKDCKFIGIDLAKAYKSQHRDWYILRTSSNWFIGNTLIPFFDSLNFYSKKKKDYQDWKSIFYLLRCLGVKKKIKIKI